MRRRFARVTDLVPLLERVVKIGQPILIIAEDLEGDALATLGRQRLPGHAAGRGREGAGLR